MAWMNAKLALLVLLPYPLFVLIARAFGRAMHHTNLAVQVGLADMSNQLQESVSGVSVVKSYAMEEATRRRFARLSQDLYERWSRLRALRSEADTLAATLAIPWIAAQAVPERS